MTPVSSPLTGHDLLHFARLRYFARRLAVVTDTRERDYLTGEIAFERRTLGELGVDMSEIPCATTHPRQGVRGGMLAESSFAPGRGHPCQAGDG